MGPPPILPFCCCRFWHLPQLSGTVAPQLHHTVLEPAEYGRKPPKTVRNRPFHSQLWSSGVLSKVTKTYTHVGTFLWKNLAELR